MSVTPVGSFSTPATKLRRMVSLSATFQTQTGTALASDAVNFVFLKSAIGSVVRPYAVVSPGQKHSYQQVAGGAQNWLRPNGTAFLYLAMDTPQEYFGDTVSAEFSAANFFGSVIDDIAGLSGADDTGSADGNSHLPIKSIEMAGFGENPEADWISLGRFYMAWYQIEWGD